MVCCVYSVAANSEKKRRKTIHNCLAASSSFFLLLSSGAYEWIASLEIFLDSSSFFSSCPALPSSTYLHHQVGYKLNEKLPLSMSIFALLPKQTHRCLLLMMIMARDERQRERRWAANCCKCSSLSSVSWVDRLCVWVVLVTTCHHPLSHVHTGGWFCCFSPNDSLLWCAALMIKIWKYSLQSSQSLVFCYCWAF